ncbi:MAG: calcium/sodium antiporter [Flavobacteriales bacterium]|tara:strand:+ start:2414 stop:3340 length:927 start_codon:yes stop_codon:yes gene_type:complete
MDYLFLALGFLFLFLGGEFLVKASVWLALKFNISKLVIGVTVVSFATSAPELLVSLESAMSGHSQISFGNVIGSNIANIGLVLGLTCIVGPMKVDKESLSLNYPMMLISSLALFLALFFFNGINWIVGSVLFLALVLFLIVSVSRSSASDQEELEVDDSLTLTKSVFLLVLGGVGLYFGADFFIKGAVSIAKSFNIDDRIISLSLVAIGTSIPELAASLIAAFKKQNGIALGNLIGSNIFNILAVLGITSFFVELNLEDKTIFYTDLIWMMAFALIIYPLQKIGKKNMLGLREGIVILAMYLAYLYFL